MPPARRRLEWARSETDSSRRQPSLPSPYVLRRLLQELSDCCPVYLVEPSQLGDPSNELTAPSVGRPRLPSPLRLRLGAARTPLESRPRTPPFLQPRAQSVRLFPPKAAGSPSPAGRSGAGDSLLRPKTCCIEPALTRPFPLPRDQLISPSLLDLSACSSPSPPRHVITQRRAQLSR